MEAGGGAWTSSSAARAPLGTFKDAYKGTYNRTRAQITHGTTAGSDRYRDAAPEKREPLGRLGSPQLTRRAEPTRGVPRRRRAQARPTAVNIFEDISRQASAYDVGSGRACGAKYYRGGQRGHIGGYADLGSDQHYGLMGERTAKQLITEGYNHELCGGAAAVGRRAGSELGKEQSQAAQQARRQSAKVAALSKTLSGLNLRGLQNRAEALGIPEGEVARAGERQALIDMIAEEEAAQADREADLPAVTGEASRVREIRQLFEGHGCCAAAAVYVGEMSEARLTQLLGQASSDLRVHHRKAWLLTNTQAPGFGSTTNVDSGRGDSAELRWCIVRMDDGQCVAVYWIEPGTSQFTAWVRPGIAGGGGASVGDEDDEEALAALAADGERPAAGEAGSDATAGEEQEEEEEWGGESDSGFSDSGSGSGRASAQSADRF